MKRDFLAALIFVASVTGLAGPVLASSAIQTIIVTLPAVDQITVTSTISLALDLTGGPGSSAVAGSDRSGRLSYTQSSAGQKKITASVIGPASNDITLTLGAAIPGGSQGTSTGTITLANGGVIPSSAQDLVTSIRRGAINNAELTYSVSATTTNTPPGDYVFTITLTSAAG